MTFVLTLDSTSSWLIPVARYWFSQLFTDPSSPLIFIDSASSLLIQVTVDFFNQLLKWVQWPSTDSINSLLNTDSSGPVFSQWPAPYWLQWTYISTFYILYILWDFIHFSYHGIFSCAIRSGYRQMTNQHWTSQNAARSLINQYTGTHIKNSLPRDKKMLLKNNELDTLICM